MNIYRKMKGAVAQVQRARAPVAGGQWSVLIRCAGSNARRAVSGEVKTGMSVRARRPGAAGAIEAWARITARVSGCCSSLVAMAAVIAAAKGAVAPVV